MLDRITKKTQQKWERKPTTKRNKRTMDRVDVAPVTRVRARKEAANSTEKSANKSFTKMTSPMAFNNKLTTNNNNTFAINNNGSSGSNDFITAECSHCSREKQVASGKGGLGALRRNRNSNRQHEPQIFRTSLPIFGFPPSSKASIYLAWQLIILTSLALLNTSQLCSAQKYTFGKSHNPLLQQAQNIVIPHIKYGQGLNRWSFLSVDRDNHGLHSDLLCPNPMMTTSTLGGISGYNRRGGTGTDGVTARVNPGRGGSKQQLPPPYQQPQYPQSRFPGGQIGAASSPSSSHQQPLPNEIWALKTDELASILPCSLRQYAVPPSFSSGNNGMVIMSGGGRGGGAGRHNANNGHFTENRILFINVSLVPFNFHGAIPCSKYIKLMYDEEEGTNLRCGDIPFDPKHENDNKYHINWPSSRPKRKDFFSLLDNLEHFLRNEQTLHRQFYFQIYFTSQINGRSKRCTVQQYELDLSYPAGNARFCNLSTSSSGGSGHEELCGEFHCDDLLFPLYADPKPHAGHHGDHQGKGGRHRGTMSMENVYDDEEGYDDEEDDTSLEDGQHHQRTKVDSNSLGQTHEGRDQQHQDQEDETNFSWTRMIRTDMRLLIFFTVVPLVLFGVLVFGLELIVYFMCCRKRRDEDDEGGGTRSQQLLENSLNVWENVPSRMDAQRTVSFSPMTTSIYGDRKNNHLQTMDAASLDSHPETPKILKSALKTKPDHGSPTTAAHHYFDYHDHDMPPSYIETTTR